MNYYPFHLGDYTSHTAHLEPMEDLAYRRLLDQYYLREGPLPCDIQTTAKLIRMRSMVADVESVLKEFFTLTDEGWRHERCDTEIDRMQDKQAKAKASAQASVNARRAKALNERSTNVGTETNERSTNAQEMQTDVELPTPTPTPKNIKRIALAPPDGVSEKTWQDFQRLRRQKRAPLTETALDGIRIEATRAGYSLEQALATCCLRGWQGFDADWVAGKQTRTDGLMAGVL